MSFLGRLIERDLSARKRFKARRRKKEKFWTALRRRIRLASSPKVTSRHQLLRYCAEAKRFYERKKAKTNNVVAIKALAHKLARACFHILKERKPFDVTRCFA